MSLPDRLAASLLEILWREPVGCAERKIVLGDNSEAIGKLFEILGCWSAR